MVLTPVGPVFEGDAVSVVLPAVDGQVGILAGRAPLIAMLNKGLLVIEQPDDVRRGLRVEGGFAEMRDNRLTVLAEQAAQAFVRAAEPSSTSP